MLEQRDNMTFLSTDDEVKSRVGQNVLRNIQCKCDLFEWRFSLFGGVDMQRRIVRGIICEA